MNLTIKSSDETIAAALAANPDIHLEAARDLAASHATSVASSPDWKFPNTQANLVDNLLSHARQKYQTQVNAVLQNLARLNYAPSEGLEVKASLKTAVIRAACEGIAVFERIRASETRNDELEKLYREVSPYASVYGSPFRQPDPNVRPVQYHETNGALAHAAIQQWQQRGVRAEVIGDDIKLSGPVMPSDIATARQAKAEIIALIPAAVVV
jgi:hypothetical protein